MLIVTTITASILGFLYVKLSLNVVGFRRKYEVSVGDGGEEELLRAIRIQANLAEYAPIALILLACLEINKAPWWITSVLAAAFVVGRMLHPIGMRQSTSSLIPRIRGMQLTLLTIIALGLANLFMIGWRLFAM